MGVSLNGGTPKSSIPIGFFPYKPSILGAHPYFWKPPDLSTVGSNSFFLLQPLVWGYKPARALCRDLQVAEIRYTTGPYKKVVK